MELTSRDILRRLGTGERITSLCQQLGWSREQFDAWWKAECQSRLPGAENASPGSIRRDRWGIPHVEGKTDTDLFFGFGFATAQDRLFQMEFLRRRALGRLAEILGPEAVESDLLHRTLDLPRVAQAEWESLPGETRQMLEAYTAGVNAWMQAARDRLPIEFDLLDYQPEPWRPTDSLAVASEFRWYLTGRFPVIAIPELVKRVLGDGPLFRAFLQGEADTESIVPPGCYAPRRGANPSHGANGEDSGGSNNWVLAGGLTTTGQPIVASDPHVPFGAVCMWHEVVLRGPSYRVAGVAYAGMPAIMIGRTDRVAWGITNNICSLRDLYMEKTDPAHPNCFLFDGQWEPARTREEVIRVRGGEPVVKTLRSSRNGPIVDEVLPGPARGKGPVSLRWQGTEPCGWLVALLGMNRAGSANEFREATRPWSVPTFNLVYADVDGHIGHQCVGRLPVRRVRERGYRPGWDPRHQWKGVIPFEEMPHQSDPTRGYVVTANNRLAPDDYPWPLSGTWSSGHRALRIREQLQATRHWSPEGCRNLQLDVTSGRAVACVPPLCELLVGAADPLVNRAAEQLRGWNGALTPDSVAAAIFSAFYPHWCRAVLAERLPAELIEFSLPNAGGLASALLAADFEGWFRSERRETAQKAMRIALDELTRRLGPEMAAWQWGRLHTLVQKHFLSSRGDLGELLDRSGGPAAGDATTVCSTTSDVNHAAHMGASYRMVTDLADPRRGIWAIGIPGVSGQPGSAHYGDQVGPWSEGALHYLALDDGEPLS